MISETSTSCTLARMVVVRSTSMLSLDGGRDSSLEARHFSHDGVDGIDYVSAGYFEDDDQDGVFELVAEGLWPGELLSGKTPVVWMSETAVGHLVPRSPTAARARRSVGCSRR